MTEFLKRAISGAIFVVVMISATYFGKTSFFCLFIALMVASLVEFYKLIVKVKSRPQILLGILIGVAFFSWNYAYALGLIEEFTVYVFVALIAAIFIVELFREHEKPIHNVAFTLMGLVYNAVPFSLLNYIVITPKGYSPIFLLAMLFLVWGNDTGAYLFGVSIGKHKMFPRISPKKSWEGFVGGVIFTAIVAFLLAKFNPQIPLHKWMILGAVSCIFAVLGDFVESMFKRAVGVKDSGKFMPGHGGVLDRFDALILVIPFIFVCLKLMLLI